MTSRLLRRGAVADAYQAAAGGPTFVSYTESSIAWGAGDGVNSNRVISSVAVQAGDFIVVMCASESTSFAWSSISDTGGNTWTSRQNQSTANNCPTRCWTATAAANATITITVVCNNNTAFGGACARVYRNAAYGGSAAETNTTEAPSVSLTSTKANSIMAYLEADWNAVDGASRTWRTANVAGTERGYFRNSSAYTVYNGDWMDVGSIGSKAVGLSAPSGQKTSQIVVEITTP